MAGEDLQNITRIDIAPKKAGHAGTHGWMVRLKRQGKLHSKFFSDSKHTGREDALEHARSWRNMMLGMLPAPEPKGMSSVAARSKSGVIGIHLTTKDNGWGAPTRYIGVSYTDKQTGARRTAGISLEKWGLRRAVWKACLRLLKERGEVASRERVERLFKTAYANIDRHMTEQGIAFARYYDDEKARTVARKQPHKRK